MFINWLVLYRNSKSLQKKKKRSKRYERRRRRRNLQKRMWEDTLLVFEEIEKKRSLRVEENAGKKHWERSRSGLSFERARNIW